MAYDLALNSDHDIYVGDDGDLQMISASDQVAQYVEIRLLSYYGEWFLDITQGTPYFQSILGRVFHPEEAAAILRRRVLNTDEVTKIENFDFNLTDRILSVSVSAQVEDDIITININNDI